MRLIGVAAACVIAAAAGVAGFTRWATRARLLDVPNNRSSHLVPTPRGGGFVIVSIVAAAISWGAYRGLFNGWVPAAAAIAVAAISGIDDVRPLPSRLRLCVHLACAAAAALAVLNVDRTTLTQVMLVLAVLWVVGLTNAFNFMDGIDGISGAQAIVSGVIVASAAAHARLPGLVLAGTAIAAASAGFLVHNWPPARVFMGDVGSTFLGFVFAVLAVQIGTVWPAGGIAIALSLWPFVFDTTLTLVRRLVRGENIFESHRSHLYQRLVIAGSSHAVVSAIYAVMAAIGGTVGLAWAIGTISWHVLSVVPLMAVALYRAVLRTEAAAHSSGRSEPTRPQVE
jgi:Fuc2NAc and GlcNAc transferase